MRTSNPVLSDRVFEGVRPATADGVMTIDGTVNKCILAVGITAATASYSFSNPALDGLYLPFIIGTLVLALIIAFKSSLAPVLTPVYAAMEGIVLGTISRMFEVSYPGIVFQAIIFTFGTLFTLLLAYKAGLISVSDKMRSGIMVATGAIMVTYLISFILSMAGVAIPFLTSSSPLSIGISFVVVAIAAANLLLDFDFIEKAAKSGSMPKYMEWYGAFGLLVTLVWLYIEILRLLAKLQSRD